MTANTQLSRQTFDALSVSRDSALKLMKPLLLEADLTEFEVEDTFSRAVISALTEPSDASMGLLVATLGASTALDLAVSKITSDELIAGLPQETIDRGNARFVNLNRTLDSALERWRNRLKLVEVQAMLTKHAIFKGKVITHTHPDWPMGFDELELSQPHLLWMRGEPRHLKWASRSVALVGSRICTKYGLNVTADLVGWLHERDYCVVSGGAYGIDAQAHRTALALQGKTISIMAGGLDNFYPQANFDLLSEVANEGLVISELAPGMSPTKWRFLQRNRLISAMTQATVVIEAGKHSGTLNTANHSEQLSRPIGAIPGPIGALTSVGCNGLIRDQRATLIASRGDLYQLLGEPIQEDFTSRLGALETRVFDAIGFSNLGVDQITAEAGITEREARTALGALQLLGLVEANGKGFSRVQSTL